MRHFLFLTFLFFPLLVHGEPSYITFPSDINWKTRETEHFQIIFREGSDAFAARALRSAENAYKILIPIFVEAPEKTWIVLADFQDSTNGYALNFPYSHIVIFASPPEATGQLSNLDNWLDSVMLHELVHILHLYPAHGLWKAMRTIFGTWVVPNGMMPSHFHEGMATFLETEKSRGGRGKGSHFASYRRKAVEAGVWGKDFAPLDLMDGTVSKWPQGMSAYFFGEILTRELWARKGPKGIYSLTQSYSDNWPYFTHSPLKEVYGLDYDALWKDIFTKTTSQTNQEIAKIKATPLSPLTYLTQTRFRKLDPTLSPDRTRVAYRLDSPYRDEGGIQIIDRSSGQILKDHAFRMGLGESLCWGKVGAKEEILFVNNQTQDFYSINGVNVLDPESGNTFPVGSLSHVHRLACSADLKTIFIYRETAGAGELQELETQIRPEDEQATTQTVRSWKLPEGAWISGILSTTSPLFTLRLGMQTILYQWKKGDDPKPLLSLSAYVHSLRQGPTAEEIWAISDISGREEVWSIHLKTKKFSKKVTVLGGLNGFDTDAGNSIVVSSYEHGGYDIARTTPISSSAIALPTPETEKPETALPKMSETESYSPLGTIFPRTWLPNLFFVPSGAQIGALVTWFDLSQRHLYSLFGGYDTRGALFGDANYSYRFGKNFVNDWGVYYAPSYIQSLRDFLRRWGGQVGLSGRIGSFPPTFRVAALYRRMEQNALQSVGVEVDMRYQLGFSRRPLAISLVNGATLSLAHQQFFKAFGSSYNYFASSASVNAYVEAPWWRDSVWFLGSRLGYTEGSPLVNSYYEGGGEVLFSQARGVFLNRGFLSGSFLARRIWTLNLEYRFPLLWVERGVGLWPGKLNVIHAALVGDVLSWDFGPSAVDRTTGARLPKDLFKRFYYSAGVELKSDWKFFYYIPTQLRIGAYHGFGPSGENIQISCGVEASL